MHCWSYYFYIFIFLHFSLFRYNCMLSNQWLYFFVMERMNFNGASLSLFHQEAGKKLTPLYGPGYTGLKNLGNRYVETSSV